MLWIYALIVALVIITIVFLCRYFALRKVISAVVIIIAVVITLFITRIYVIPNYVAWSIENQIRTKYPLFDYIAIRAPGDFNPYIDEVKKDILSNVDVDKKIEENTRLFLNAEVEKYFQIATNQSIYDYTKTLYTLYRKLITINPILVLAAEFPNKFSAGSPQINSTVDSNQIMAAKEAIIKSAIESPEQALTAADNQQAKTIVQSIVLDLADKYGKDAVIKTFEHPDDATLDQKTAATILIDFYNNLLARGVEDTGLVMKYSLNPKNAG